MKRTLDILFATGGIIFLAPIGMLISLSIALTSPGPVIFRQKRLGLGGQLFHICKFRTMFTDQSGDACRVTAAGNSRITPVGAWLRRTKLDEIPQLFNVLVGQMSFVGPRPEVAEFADLFPRHYDRILSVRPGITHRATLMFRREEEILAAASDPCRHYVENVMPIKLAAYEEGLEASLAQDIQTIVQTVLPYFGESPLGPEYFAPALAKEAKVPEYYAAPQIENIPAVADDLVAVMSSSKSVEAKESVVSDSGRSIDAHVARDRNESVRNEPQLI